MNIQKEMQKIVPLLIIPLFILAALSCSDDSYCPGTDPTPEQNPYVSFGLSLELPSAGQPSTNADLKTRATDTYDGELEIATIDVLAFSPEDKKLLFRVEADSIITDETDKTLTTCRVIMKRGTYDLMVLINARNELLTHYPDLTEEDGYTLGDVQADMLIYSAIPWNATYETNGYTPIPMWGMNKNIEVDGETFVQGSNIFKMTRVVARIDVSLSDVAKANFTMTAIHLYNYNDHGQLIPDEETFSNGYVTSPTVPAQAAFAAQPYTYTGSDVIIQGGTVCSGAIYTFEAVKGTREEYLKNTCLVIEGTYKGEPGHYYRMDFTTKEDNKTVWLDILRNHIYNVTITKVDGPGYRDREDAYKSLPENMEAEIVNWNASDMSNVIFDGQYYLGVNSPEISVSSMATISSLGIETNCPQWSYTLTNNSDPKATNPGTPTWLSITSGHTAGTNYTTSTDELKFNVNQNTSGAERVCYLHLTAGRFTLTVKITQGVWYINGVSVTPNNREAASGGQDYSITISGYYDKIPLRFTNLTNNTVVMAELTGNTSNNQTTGSYTYSIGEYWTSSESSRQYLIEYQDVVTGEWKTVIDPLQLSYWIKFETAANAGLDLDEIYGWGNYLDVNVSGNYPDIYIRMQGYALQGQTNNSKANAGYEYPTKMPSSTSTAVQNRRMYIPYNPGALKRNVYLEYRVTNQEVWNQVSDVKVTQLAGNRILIDDYTEWSRGWDVDIYTWIKSGVNAGVSDSDANANRTTGKMAPLTNVPEGRIVAYQDYEQFLGKTAGSYNHNQATADALGTKTWFEAMGIPVPNYTNSNYEATGKWSDNRFLNYDYTPTRTTGCGGYWEGSETDANTGIGQWRLPTHFEAYEIARLEASSELEGKLGYVFNMSASYANRSFMWTSTEYHNQWNTGYYYKESFANPGDWITYGPYRATYITKTHIGPTTVPTYTDLRGNVWNGLVYPDNANNVSDGSFASKVFGNAYYSSNITNSMITRCVRSKTTSETGGPDFVPSIPW